MIGLLLASALAVSAEADYHGGLEAWRAGDEVAARAAFLRVVEGSPADSSFHRGALYNLGRMEQRAGDPCAAVRWLDRLLATDPPAAQAERAREHRRRASAACDPVPAPVRSWRLGGSLAGGVVGGAQLRRSAVEAEVRGGRRFGSWVPRVAVAVAVEPPAPVLLRAGIDFAPGPWRVGGFGQALVRPALGAGVALGGGWAIPFAGWDLVPGLEAGWWPGEGVWTGLCRLGFVLRL